MSNSSDKEAYLTLAHCHAVIMRNGSNPKLLNELEDWLDEHIGIFDYDSKRERKEKEMKVVLIIEESVQASKDIIEANSGEDIKERISNLIDERVQEVHIKKEPPNL